MHLLREVERFLRQKGITPTRFGREAMNDPRFVFSLRKGTESRPATEERARKYMRDYPQ